MEWTKEICVQHDVYIACNATSYAQIDASTEFNILCDL